MKIDITSTMSNEEYDKHIDIVNHYYESLQEFSDFFHYDMSKEEENYIKDLKNRTKDFLAFMKSNKEYFCVVKNDHISFQQLKWLNEKNIQYIHYIDPLNQEYLYIKSEWGSKYFNLKYNSTSRDGDWMVKYFNWSKIDIVVKFGVGCFFNNQNDMLKWIKNNCKGLVITDIINNRHRATYLSVDYKLYFECKEDLIFFKMVI